jgi:hypothetical protein
VFLALPIIPSAEALSGLGNWISLLQAIGAVLLLIAILRFGPAYTVLASAPAQSSETAVTTTFTSFAALIGGILCDPRSE